MTMALTEPTAQETLALFKDIETSFPSESLGEDKWQILTVRFRHLQNEAFRYDTLIRTRSQPYPQADIRQWLQNSTSI